MHRPSSWNEEQDTEAAVQCVVAASLSKASRDRVQPFLRPDGKVHFGSNSLKALVKRAGDLRDALDGLVRAVDPGYVSLNGGGGGGSGLGQSPRGTRRAANDGTPAFTRVFATPPPSPSRRLAQGSGMLGRSSLEASPSSISQCMQMMTVGGV